MKSEINPSRKFDNILMGLSPEILGEAKLRDPVPTCPESVSEKSLSPSFQRRRPSIFGSGEALRMEIRLEAVPGYRPEYCRAV
jgi:hypothetical protein